MSEIIPSNPNKEPTPELLEQARRVIDDVLNNPQSIGASAEDGSYHREEDKNGFLERILVEQRQEDGLSIEASRKKMHDPEFHMPGFFEESASVAAVLPGIGHAHVMILNGEVVVAAFSDYQDTSATRRSEVTQDGLANALTLITTVKESLEV